MCSQSRDTTVCISCCLRLLFVRRMRSSTSLAGAPARRGSLGRTRAPWRQGARARIAHKSIGVPGTGYGITTAERRSALAPWRARARPSEPARLGQNLELRMRRTKRRRRQREIQTVVSLDWLHIRRLKLHHDTQCLIENRPGYSIP